MKMLKVSILIGREWINGKKKDKRRKDGWDTCNWKSSSSREKPHTLAEF